MRLVPESVLQPVDGTVNPLYAREVRKPGKDSNVPKKPVYVVDENESSDDSDTTNATNIAEAFKPDTDEKVQTPHQQQKQRTFEKPKTETPKKPTGENSISQLLK